MIELEIPAQKTSEQPADTPGRQSGRGVIRRRSTMRVLVISGFILLTVWGVHYFHQAHDVLDVAAKNGQGQPWGQIFDPSFVAKSCPQALLLLVASVVGFYLVLRTKPARPLERLILETLGKPVSNEKNRQPLTPTLSRRERGASVSPLPLGEGQGVRAVWTWIALGLATVAAAIAILEWIEPCYFVQDDNFSGALPVVLHGCRSLFQSYEFPDFDPCQLMGIPSAGSVLYPPMVVSYAIARWGLGNENYTIEVFAAMHLLGGYLASFAAARMAGLRPALAFVLGISFTLSGYILLVGRGWFFVLTMVVWLPLLFCVMENWLKGRVGWRWLLTAGFTIGGFYYTGFPQVWFYSILLLACTTAVAVICGRVGAPARGSQQLIWPLAAGLLGLALLLPTLIVQLEITRGMQEKPASFGMGIEQGLVATVAPFPFTRAEGFMPLPANREPHLETQWYYAGTFLMAGAFLVLGATLAYRFRRAWWGQHPWTAAAILSLWLALGKDGLLWTAVGNLPVIRSVNHHPHRLMPFVVFFSLIVGGIFLEHLLRRSASRRWEFLIAAATAVLMLYHVSLSRNSLWCYGDRPYPELPRDIAERVLPSQNQLAGRVWSFAPWRSGLPGFANTLPLSLPSAYGAYSFGGYDPVTEARPETRAIQDKFAASPVEASRAYGIRWVLVANADYYKQESEYWRAVRKNRPCFDVPDSRWPSFGEKFLPTAKLRIRREEVSLYELPDASPLAFDRANPRAPLPIDFHGWGAQVDVPGTGPRTVVVNIAARPWMRAACGKQPLQSSPDDWGRMEVRVPDGVTRFRVLCDLPWLRGILCGMGLATATLGGVFLVRKRI